MIIPVQPKLAPLPLSRNQQSFLQDMRVGASGLPPSFPTKFSNSGHPGGLPSHGPPNMYGNAAFAQSTSVGPHPRMFGAPDSPIYLQTLIAGTMKLLQWVTISLPHL
ncbi:hypothetical protein HPP92_010319 [Vanilla planifolia]|uniref:Uncharacterized protein n=1 Tax=Vanilla planifolia TaxID=51239 RepID=A0A835R684_VANPL|nr:hypothetical protein HPP92_010319 [Vanilla planifolia]